MRSFSVPCRGSEFSWNITVLAKGKKNIIVIINKKKYTNFLDDRKIRRENGIGLKSSTKKGLFAIIVSITDVSAAVHIITEAWKREAFYA